MTDFTDALYDEIVEDAKAQLEYVRRVNLQCYFGYRDAPSTRMYDMRVAKTADAALNNPQLRNMWKRSRALAEKRGIDWRE